MLFFCVIKKDTNIYYILLKDIIFVILLVSLKKINIVCY